MKKLSFLGTIVLVSLFSFGAFAQTGAVSVSTPTPDKTMVLGAYMAMGMANMLFDEGDTGFDVDNKFRFAGGGGAYFDFYMSPIVALDFGLGFIGRGTMESDDDWKSKTKLMYMEIPIGIKLDFSGFQLGAGVAMFLAMSGKDTYSDDDNSSSSKWEDESWDYHSRFNLGAKLFVGYAIPVGPIAIVPGLEWSMDLLNNAKDDLADADVKLRYMNIMFRLGVDFAL